MFERYTNDARKAIFYARYEAAQCGSDHIEPEHLVLGVLEVEPEFKVPIADRFEKLQALRQQVMGRYPPVPPRPGGKPSRISVDLPLSSECKRVLGHAHEEAQAARQKNVDVEHLLLGVLRLKGSFAVGLLEANGITAAIVKETMSRPAEEPKEPEAAAPGARDLTREARNGRLHPLIGRERELERALQILSRRTHRSVVLVGEPGVGKTAIVEGIAQRIAEGNVPPELADLPVVLSDSGTPDRPDVILWIPGLFDQVAAGKRRLGVPPSARCITTATPAGYRQVVDKAPALARLFEAVVVLPLNEEQAAEVLRALKESYERYHGITIGEGAIAAAIRVSGVFLRHRQLPDRALDLIDEAGARLKMRRESEPREIVELRRRIRQQVREMENAIANHKFDEARKHAEAERADRDNLLRMLEERKTAGLSNVLAAADIEEVIADRTGAPVSAVRTVLAQAEGGEFERTAQELGAQIPVELREWVPFLAAWVANCPADDAEKLAYSIRWLKSRSDSGPASQS